MKKTLLWLCFSFLFLSTAEAQFGKFKEKLKQQLENIVDDEKEKAKENLEEKKEDASLKLFKEAQAKQLAKDTTYYNFSFAQAEKISFFTSRDDDQNALFSFSKLYDNSNEALPEPRGYELAFDHNRAGSNSMAINRLLAMYKFAEALNIYFNVGITDSLVWKSGHLDLVRLTAALNKDTLTVNDYYAIGKTVSNVAIWYHTSGLFSFSQELNQSLIYFIKENIGSQSLMMASVYNNIGLIESSLGNYNVAEEYMVKSSSILLQRKDELKLDLAVLSNNQAMLYQQTGQYEKAISKIDEAIDIAQSEINNKGADYSKLKLNKALFLKSQQKYDQAEELLAELKKTKEKRFGTRHQDYADIQSILASLYMEMGKTELVEPLLLNALDIYQKKFNEQHPTYSNTLRSLGIYYLFAEQYSKSRVALEKAKGLIETTFGTNHPDYLAVNESLAVLSWNEGNVALAQSEFVEVCNANLDMIEKFFPSMSENEKSKFWGKTQNTFLKFYAFVADNYQDYPDLVKEMYNVQLATKGILLNSTSKVRQAILSSDDQALKKEYTDWISTKEHLAIAYSMSKAQLSEQKVNVDSLEQKANTLEKNLGKKSNEFASAQSLRNVTVKDVTNKLVPTEVAIEIVRFPKFKKAFSNDIQYAYLILDNTGKINFVLRTNGNELEDKFASRYRKSIQFKIEDQHSYEDYWSFLTDIIATKNTIYLSVDGIYNQINVNTLKKPDGHYLVDDQHIINLPSIRDIKKQSSALAKTKNILIFGNPDFGGSGKIADLPGTKLEVEKISSLAKKNGVTVKSFQRKEANEFKFKSEIKSPEVLHVATHGFFLNDVENEEGVIFGVEISKAKENPLLRSGLMLADADKTIDQVASNEVNSSDNGILTAYEVMNLNLKQTKLVVLSACETGLGEIKSGEGVYGLQRAFQLAGAETVIMSLWKVNDEATQQLMTTFYSEWMKSGDKFRAFQLAQKNMREQYEQPYYWGAFVMMN